MRRTAALLALVLAACGTSNDARRAGEVRYEGRTLQEWWLLRRDPNDATSAQARRAIRAIGAAGVPFVAEKAASHELGDNIGAGVVLEDLCPDALPAMEAARETYPSPALEAAIRRVKSNAADPAHAALCAAGGDSARREEKH